MLALDILLLVTIVVCIVYCWVLSKRIQDLHNSRVEFARMVKEFDSSIARADESIASMITTGDKAANQIDTSQSQIDKVTILLKDIEHTMNDLNLMNELGTNVANRIEDNISKAKDMLSALSSKLEMMDIAMNQDLLDPSVTKNLGNIPIASAKDKAQREYDDTDNTIDQKNVDAKLEDALQNIVSNQKTSNNVVEYWDTLRKISTQK